MSKIRQRQANVGIIGLGYVGLPLALLYSEQKFRVSDLVRIRRYRRGISLMTAAGTGLADAALTGKSCAGTLAVNLPAA